MADHEDHDLRIRAAAGEAEARPPAPPSTAETVRKDMTYSPASETETERKQEDPMPDSLDDDIDPRDVRAVPGTGGPDDAGDVEVDAEDLNLPGTNLLSDPQVRCSEVGDRQGGAPRMHVSPR